MTPQTRWRDHLRVHPAAEFFPPMSRDELLQLGDDIKAAGGKPLVPITLYQPKQGEAVLLDGRNRLDAMEAAGLSAVNAVGSLTIVFETIEERDGFDPFEYVLSLNMHRRHLTGDQRARVIRELKAARPDLSIRSVAAMTGASAATVHRALNKSSEPSGVSSGTPDQAEAAPADISEPDPAAAPPEPSAPEEPTPASYDDPSASRPPTAHDQPAPAVVEPLPVRITGRDGKSYAPKAQHKRTTAAAPSSTNSFRKPRGQTRDEAIVQIVAELKRRPADTIDAFAKLCRDARNNVLGIPERRRVELLFAMTEALGFDRQGLLHLVHEGNEP